MAAVAVTEAIDDGLVVHHSIHLMPARFRLKQLKTSCVFCHSLTKVMSLIQLRKKRLLVFWLVCFNRSIRSMLLSQHSWCITKIDEKFQHLVSEILPSYINDDYPTFVLFLKSFYEYLELEGGTRFTAVKLNTYRDIDQTLDTFIDHMMSEFAAGFPDQIESGMSKRQILKN